MSAWFKDLESYHSAIHEAGHCVCAAACHHTPESVSLRSTRLSIPQELDEAGPVLLGGFVAAFLDGITPKDRVRDGAEVDFAQVAAIAPSDAAERSLWIGTMIDETESILRKRWGAVGTIARALLDRGSLDRGDVMSLYYATPQQPLEKRMPMIATPSAASVSSHTPLRRAWPRWRSTPYRSIARARFKADDERYGELVQAVEKADRFAEMAALVAYVNNDDLAILEHGGIWFNGDPSPEYAEVKRRLREALAARRAAIDARIDLYKYEESHAG
ncbi:MAG TPA: hypothetical protein PKY77_25915 [Phycisphaerae bacterium]|nr:hypothetical protein [Phycisphaerae bacterium]HRY66845.1 hypothetical protein [Phycisphaerae bacterium]HSA26903.1 hypothetical protein [Phycisphaerae bacterium]